jgi:cytochrome c oxidase cbb3-type subunit 3
MTAMSDREENIVHEVDGIQEADNELPRWWLYTLFGAIVFAAGYWLYYEEWRTGLTPEQEFRVEKLEKAKREAARLEAEGPFTPAKLEAMARNEAIVSSGKSTFAATCASCHAANGGGQVGPNLTDEYWVHGGSAEKILQSVRTGWVDKGMPAWGPQLGEQKVREVTAYVISLKGTKVAGGKPPQGTME